MTRGHRLSIAGIVFLAVSASGTVSFLTMSALMFGAVPSLGQLLPWTCGVGIFCAFRAYHRAGEIVDWLEEEDEVDDD